MAEPTSPPERINWRHGDLILVEHVTTWMSNAAAKVKSGQSSTFWFGTVEERFRDEGRHVPRTVRRLDTGVVTTISVRRKERRSGIVSIVPFDRHDSFWWVCRADCRPVAGWPESLHAVFTSFNDAKAEAAKVLFGGSAVEQVCI